MKLALFGVAVFVAAASVTPAVAQAVIDNPGMCEQFYPNANCENLGPGNPYTDGGYFRNNWQNSSTSMEHHFLRRHTTYHEE